METSLLAALALAELCVLMHDSRRTEGAPAAMVLQLRSDKKRGLEAALGTGSSTGEGPCTLSVGNVCRDRQEAGTDDGEQLDSGRERDKV